MLPLYEVPGIGKFIENGGCQGQGRGREGKGELVFNEHSILPHTQNFFNGGNNSVVGRNKQEIHSGFSIVPDK